MILPLVFCFLYEDYGNLSVAWIDRIFPYAVFAVDAVFVREGVRITRRGLVAVWRI